MFVIVTPTCGVYLDLVVVCSELRCDCWFSLIIWCLFKVSRLLD